MSDGSTIEWLGLPGYIPMTLNVGLGCFPVSDGCTNCYAPFSVVRQAHLEGRDGIVVKNADGKLEWTGKVVLLPQRLAVPRKMRNPRMIFINALMDLFSHEVSYEFLVDVWQMMADTPRHIYVILSKQPKRMRDMIRKLAAQFGVLRNVWIGVSAEDQHTAEIRIPLLFQTPAAVRVVSCEPLLSPINLTRLAIGPNRWLDALAGDLLDKQGVYAAAPAHLDWVIAGGESAPRADVRPAHPEWVRILRDHTVAAGRAFFFKQWGSWAPAPWMVPLPDDIDKRYAAAGATGGQKAADEVLAAAKREAEQIGATHFYNYNAHLYGWQLGEAGHKPYSSERRELAPHEPNAPMRYYRGKSAGAVLDGRVWHQWPTADGRIIEAKELAHVG